MCRTTAVRHSGAPLSAACQRRHYVRKNGNQNGCLLFCPASLAQKDRHDLVDLSGMNRIRHVASIRKTRPAARVEPGDT